MSTQVLILCPHNAAKSVAAATYLERMAETQQLEVTIDTAGTEPDDKNLPLVQDQLEADGYEVTSEPRLLVASDLETADLVVNFGCSLDHLPAHPNVQDWTVPNFSENPSEAFAAIAEHVEKLAASLSS